MARLSAEQWDKVKADWCTGAYTYQQLSELHGVSDAAIIKKKNIEGWIALSSGVVDGYVEARAQAKLAIAEVSKVSKVSSTNLENSLDRVTVRRMRAEDIGMNVLETINSQIMNCQEPKDAKELALGFKAVYEPMFKTTPDTAIQINNSNQPQGLSVEFIKPKGADNGN